MHYRSLLSMLVFALMLPGIGLLAGEDATVEQFHQASKKGHADAVKEFLERGVDVDARSTYGATALSFASQHGHLGVVRMLLNHDATVDARDRFYKVTPLWWAAGSGHAEIIRELIAAGAVVDFGSLEQACSRGHIEAVGLLLSGGSFDAARLSNLLISQPDLDVEIAGLLRKAGGDPSRNPSVVIEPEEFAKYAGIYVGDEGREIEVIVRGPRLDIFAAEARIHVLEPAGGTIFCQVGNEETMVAFHYRDGEFTALTLVAGRTQRYSRSVSPTDSPTDSPTRENFAEIPATQVTQPANWPSFRGQLGTGVADGQHPPVYWDVASGKNIRWKATIDGLGHSCPIIWGDDVFLTSAVSGSGDHSLRTGQYGDVDSVDDSSEHVWNLICLDKESGETKWTRTMHRGVPQVKRHLKSTHCNSTPATDGTHVVVSLGSEGLFCFDMAGQLLWRRDLGKLASGWFYDDALEWGFGSSPIIYGDLTIQQCDVGQGSFIAAFELATGEEVWRRERDEIPSWSTPTIFHGEMRDELITSATNAVRAYDPRTGEELWRMTGMSEVTIPTPVVSDELIYVTSGYQTQPIFAVRGGGSGDISLQGTDVYNEFIAWSLSQGGPYMPTPIVYRDRLYICPNNGVLACYDARSGARLYRKRLGGGGGYTASLVAADNAIYVISENGDVHVVRAGDNFELFSRIEMNETCMATPAISAGMIFIRTQHHLYGIGTP